MQLSGTYLLQMPLPGGARPCRMCLEQAGAALGGYLENPYAPEERCPLTGSVEPVISIRTMVGRTAFELGGTAEERVLHLSLTTRETIPLEAGYRVGGQTGQLDGEYVVGIYSPGGVKENHLILKTHGDAITGEMFCLAEEKMLRQMEELAQRGGPGPGGPGSGAPGPGGPGPARLPQLGEKLDVNLLRTGSGTADAFCVETVTAQGSLFQFEGRIEGDAIFLTMHVTDHTDDIVAEKVK